MFRSSSISLIPSSFGSAYLCLGQETLSTQLQRGKVDAYLLTQGIEQAGKVSYQSRDTSQSRCRVEYWVVYRI